MQRLEIAADRDAFTDHPAIVEFEHGQLPGRVFCDKVVGFMISGDNRHRPGIYAQALLREKDADAAGIGRRIGGVV